MAHSRAVITSRSGAEFAPRLSEFGFDVKMEEGEGVGDSDAVVIFRF